MGSVKFNFRVDAQLKEDAEMLFKNAGLDLSTALRIFLQRTIVEQKFPFALFPGEKTAAYAIAPVDAAPTASKTAAKCLVNQKPEDNDDDNSDYDPERDDIPFVPGYTGYGEPIPVARATSGPTHVKKNSFWMIVNRVPEFMPSGSELFVEDERNGMWHKAYGQDVLVLGECTKEEVLLLIPDPEDVS